MPKDGIVQQDLGADPLDRHPAEATRLIARLVNCGFQIELEPFDEAALFPRPPP